MVSLKKIISGHLAYMDIITVKALTNYQRHCPFTSSVYNWMLILEVPEDLTPTEER